MTLIVTTFINKDIFPIQVSKLNKGFKKEKKPEAI